MVVPHLAHDFYRLIYIFRGNHGRLVIPELRRFVPETSFVRPAAQPTQAFQDGAAGIATAAGASWVHNMHPSLGFFHRKAVQVIDYRWSGFQPQRRVAFPLGILRDLAGYFDTIKQLVSRQKTPWIVHIGTNLCCFPRVHGRCLESNVLRQR